MGCFLFKLYLSYEVSDKVLYWYAVNYCVRMQHSIVSISIKLLCRLRKSAWQVRWLR